MNIFLTGGSGWIGSATLAQLRQEGHAVTALARSDDSARKVAAAGAEPLLGSLADTDLLARAAADSDAVVHLGFHHDFSDMAGAGRLERAAMEAFGTALAGTGKPLLFASGTAMMPAAGRLLLESDAAPGGPDAPRGGAEELGIGLAAKGVRSVAMRFAPTVHGEGDYGFVAVLAQVARSRGVSGYIGTGENRWPAVHRSDIATLIGLALEGAPAGSVLHGVAEEGIATADIAEAIGAAVGVPTVSVDPAAAGEHFGWLSAFYAMDLGASNAATRALLGWEPTGPTLAEDVRAGHYSR